MGYNVDQAEELARVTTMFKNVGDNMTADDASSYMISTLQGFQMQAEESQRIVDVYNEVANSFAIDTSGIGEALKRSAAAMNTANTSLEKSVALVTAANTVIQDPEVVGTAFKTISARIRGAKTEIEDLGDETDAYVESTSKLRNTIKSITGVDIIKEGTKDEYKDIYTILLGIADRWEYLSDLEKSTVAEAIAGKRGLNVFSAIVGDPETLRKAYATAMDSEGSAAREQQNWQKSIQYSIDRMKAASQELATDFIQSSWIKDSIDLLTKLIEVLDKLMKKVGSLGPVLATSLTLLSNGGIKGIGEAFANNKWRILSYDKTTTPIKTFNDAAYNAALQKEAGAYISDTSAYTTEQLESIIDNAPDAVKSLDDIKAGCYDVTEATSKSNVALGAMGKALVSIGISAAIALIYEFINAQDKLNLSVQKAAEDYTNLSTSIDDYKKKIEEDYEILNSSTSTYEEMYAARQDLYSIQNSLIEQYPEEAKGLDLVTDSVNKQKQAFEELEKVKSNGWEKTKNEINNAGWLGNAVNSIRALFQGTPGASNYEMEVNRLSNYVGTAALNSGYGYNQKMIDAMSQRVEGFTNDRGLATVNGDIKTVYDSLIKLQDIAKEFGEDQVADAIGIEADKVRQEIEEVGDFYDQYIYNEKILKDESKNGAKETYKAYMEAYDKYQKAVLDGDEETINTTSDKLSNIFSDIDTSNWDQSVKDWFYNLIPELQDEISKTQFEIKFKATPDKQETDDYYVKKSNSASKSGYSLGLETRTNRQAVIDALGYFNSSDEILNGYITDGRIDKNKTIGLDIYGETALDNLQKAADNYGVTVAEVVTQALAEGLIKSQTQIDFNQLMASANNFENNPGKATAQTKNYKDALEKVNNITKDFNEEQQRLWLSIQKGEVDATKQLINYNNYYKELASPKTISEAIDSLTGMSGRFDALDEIYSDIKDGDVFDFSKLDSKKFEEFKTLGIDYQEFVEGIVSTYDDPGAAQKYFDEIVSAMLDAEIAASNLSEENKDLYINYLNLYGVKNSEEVINDRLAVSRAKEAKETEALTWTINTNTAALLNEAGASDIDRIAIAQLYLEKLNINGIKIDTASDVQNIINMGNAAGASAEALTKLATAKSALGVLENSKSSSRAITYAQSQLASVQSDLDAMQNGTYDWKFKYTPAEYTGGDKTNKTPGGGGGSESSPKTYTWIEQAEKANERKRQAAANYLESSNYSYDDMADRIGGTQETQNAIRGLETESKKLTNKWQATRQKLVNAFGEEYTKMIEEDLAEGGGAYGDWMSEYTELTGKDIKDSQYKLLDGAEEVYAAMMDNETELAELREMGLESAANGENALLAADKERISLLQQEKDLYNQIWQDDVAALKATMGDTEETAALIQKILNGDLTKEGYRDIFTTEKGGTLSNAAQEALDTAIEDAETMQDIDNEIFDAKEQLFNDEIALYEKHIKQLQSESDQIQATLDEFNDSLDLKETIGKLTTEGDYKSLIQTSQALAASYQSQLSVLNDELEFIEAEGRAESEAYYNVLNQINSIESAIRDCTKQQAEWNETIKRLPIERLEKYLGILDNIAQDIKNYLSINDAKGINQTAEEIQKQVNVSKESLTKLLEQAELYRKNLAGYEWGSDKYQETVDSIQEIENSISDVIVQMVEWNKQLLNLPIDNINTVNEKLGLISSALGTLGEDYDTALSGVSFIINKQTDALNDEKDAFNKLYDEKVKAIQEVIDALQKENEARQHQLALEDAMYNLEKANNQKTIQTIKDGHLEYIADQEAIRDAQNALDQAQYENQVYRLQEQIDALEKERDNQNEIYEKQLEALNKQAEKWSEIVSDIQGARDALSADQFLGENWVEKVLGGTDSEIFAAFKALYQGFSDQQFSVDKQIESNERLVTVMQQYVDAYIKGEITYSEALDGINSAVSTLSDGITGAENLANTLKLFGEGDIPDILSTLEGMVRQESQNYQKYFELTEANNTIIGKYTDTWQKLVVSVDAQIDALKKAYEAAEAAAQAAAAAATVITATVSKSTSSGSSGRSGWIVDNSTYGPAFVNKYHEGISLGYVGGMTSDEKLKALKEMSLKPLEANEIPAFLKKGELVFTADQQSRLISNFSRMNQLGQIGTVQKQTVVNMTLSNLTFNEVQNGQDFAQYIVKNLSSAVQQGINKR